jgi:hypothetical protein
MIDWYVEISEEAPDGFRGDKYLGNVIDTATPCMNHLCNRLTEMNDWKLEDVNKIFMEIIDELPIMKSSIYNNEFVINYNRWVTIKLTDTTKQIYRDLKLSRILA